MCAPFVDRLPENMVALCYKCVSSPRPITCHALTVQAPLFACPDISCLVGLGGCLRLPASVHQQPQSALTLPAPGINLSGANCRF